MLKFQYLHARVGASSFLTDPDDKSVRKQAHVPGGSVKLGPPKLRGVEVLVLQFPDRAIVLRADQANAAYNQNRQDMCIVKIRILAFLMDPGFFLIHKIIPKNATFASPPPF